ncbi:MAG: hypothetical protein RR290_00140 [Clostridia bacterium]
MNRYLGIVNYNDDISNCNFIEEMHINLKKRFSISECINMFKTKHINLSNGFFSKSFDKNKYCIMHTGKIYNIKDIKNKLIKLGYCFNTKTNLRKSKVIPEEYLDTYLDAEILLSCYNEYKEKFLELLDGVFAICIYDKINDTIFLAKDRIGVKPLYYMKNDNNFIFSTNIKDILCIPNIEAKIDKQSALELIALRPCTYTRNYIFQRYF